MPWHCDEPDRYAMPFSYFPRPIEGELLYSMLARYFSSLHLSSAFPVVQEAFGCGDAQRTTMPGNIRHFALTVFGDPEQADRLVNEHTAYPYLSAFLDHERRDLVRSSMMTTGRYIARRKGFIGTTGSDFLRFCPECVRMDIKAEGQAAWRREHQLHGVFVCPTHLVPLREGTAASYTTRLQACTTDPEAGEDIHCPIPPELARTIATGSLWLLRHGLRAGSRMDLVNAVRKLLKEGGWISGNSNVSPHFVRRLFEMAEPFRTPLTSPGIGRSRRIANTWARRSKMVVTPSPLDYLLVLALLERPVSDLQVALDNVLAAPPPQRSPVSAPLAKWSTKRISQCRERMLSAIEANPSQGRAAVYREVGSGVAYLKVHDREWLVANLPPVIGRKRLVNDAVLARKVKPAALKVFANEAKPFRASFAKLSRLIAPPQTITNHRHRLPLTIAALKTWAESCEAYAYRRLELTALNAVLSGTGPALCVSRMKVCCGNPWSRELKAYAYQLLEAVDKVSCRDDKAFVFRILLRTLRAKRCGSALTEASLA